ncbi:MAG: 5-formyltetrahydrofolate cyclo-ligase [Acetobacteraceae bacterium]|nr:5-formyltetrahydrofolate cyclo-ligase [Acetobacteraceae bacterium]
MAAPHTSSELDQAKRAARQRAMLARAGCDPQSAGVALAERVLLECPPPAGAVVSGFWPMGDEIDIRPLLLALHARGHPIVLPVTPNRGNPLSFRLWRPGDALIPEKFGTMRPTGEERQPGFLLVPLLAFDRRGYRLGYGAGFYDRTLAALSDRFALGCAFAAQEVDTVPTGPRDQRLDAVATEHGVIFCKDI